MMMFFVTVCILFLSLSVFLYSFLNCRSLLKNEKGNEKMISISEKISTSAMQFLKCLYRYLSIFIGIVSVLLIIISFNVSVNKYIGHFSFLYFVFGAAISMVAAFVGMRISTKFNVYTAQAASSSVNKAFNISFGAASVIGSSIVFLGIFGLSLLFFLYLIFCKISGIDFLNSLYLENFVWGLVCFALGAESVALFCRVAGGIYTKAADISADLVGKIEKDIPEDDPRNPAVIADNVGDNVGDIAGMGSDLFGSFVSSIVAAVFMWHFVGSDSYQSSSSRLLLYLFPLFFVFCCSLVSIIINRFILIINTEEIKSLFRGGMLWSVFFNAVIAMILCFGFSVSYLSVLCIFVGLIISVLINYITDFYTANGFSPLNYIIKQTRTGAATNVLAGLCVGMESLVLPVLLYSFGFYLSYTLNGFYGVSMVSVGIISMAIIQLSMDAFGPICDNAGAIAEMSGLGKSTRRNTDVLDSIGNTTAAIGKSFAITSALFTFFSLFVSLDNVVDITESISDMCVIVGVLFGSMVPFVFSSVVIKSVGNAALLMVDEVRRQFKTIVGISDGTAEPQYNRCINISTEAAFRGMIKPGIIVLFLPVFLVIFTCDMKILVGFLVGISISSVLLGIFQFNAGGAWDNAKKLFEDGVEVENERYGKESEFYKSAVVGDTVGDPLKDTSGPSMNIVMKLSIIVSLIVSLFFVSDGSNADINRLPKCKDNSVRVCDVLNNEFNSEYCGKIFDSLCYDTPFNICNDSSSIFSHRKSKKPKVYVNSDKNGNYEKLCKYDDGYSYEYRYHYQG